MRRTINGLAIFGLMLVVSTTAFAQGKGNGNGKGGGGGDDGGDAPPPLPAVQYEINRVSLPVNAASYINDVNNLGQVVGWVSFLSSDGSMYGPRRAFVADPAINTFVFLDSAVASSNIPSGFSIASAVGINDHGVVVGYLSNEANERLSYAVDLSLPTLVLDLLPSTGFSFEYARRINNRGEIVGIFFNDSAASADDHYSSAWYLDPGLYGDPATRIVRDGDGDGSADVLPIDMSDQSPISLESIVGPTSSSIFIGNPDENGPTIIGGSSAIDDVPFRLVVGSNSAEFLTGLMFDGTIEGMDSSGAVVGQGFVPAAKGKKLDRVYYRYSSSVEILPEPFPRSAGRVGEVLLEGNSGRGVVYRDWLDGEGPRGVELDELVVGTDEDLISWFAAEQIAFGRMSSGGVIACKLNDRDELVTLFEVPQL